MKHTLICMSFIFIGSMAHAASFDCTKAATPIEKTICSDSQLSDFDSQLMQSYKKSLSSSANADILKPEQRTWLSTVRNKCQDAECLKQAYADRIARLEGMAAVSSGSATQAASIRPTNPASQSPVTNNPASITDRPGVSNANGDSSIAKQKPQELPVLNETEFKTKWKDFATQDGIRASCIFQLPKADPTEDEYENLRKIFDAYDQQHRGVDLADKISGEECDCENKARQLSRSEWQWNSKCHNDHAYAIRKMSALASKKYKEKIETEKLAKRQDEAKRIADEKAEQQQRKVAAETAKHADEEAKIAAEKQRQLQDQQRFIAQKRDTKNRSHIPGDNALVWAASAATPEQRIADTDSNDCFGWVNYFLRSRTEGQNVFHPPTKTEFEKSAEYDARMSQARTKFLSERTQRDLVYREIFESLLLDQLGSPMVSEVKYNADTEEFTLNVTSSMCRFDLPIKLKSSAKNAQQMKTDLLQMRPIVIFEFSGDALAAKYAELYNKEKLAYTSAFSVPSKLRFNEENAVKWQLKFDRLTKDAQVAAAEARHQEMNKLKNTLWYRYLMAINVSGSICEVYRNQIKSFSRMGVEENQINALTKDVFQSANRDGCVK